MIKVIYPGTFDPITNGHLDIIERTAKLFPKVLVAVANNPTKRTLFSYKERVELTKKTLAHLDNVKVFGFSGLLAKVVAEQNIQAIIRGVRNTTDFEYECQLAQVSSHLAENVESIFLPPSAKWGFVSSTVVREVYLHNGDIKALVPNTVYQALNKKDKYQEI